MIPCYIINLECDIKNFEKQQPYLQEEGFNPIRFIGVDARKNEHLKYNDYVTPWCQKFCPTSAIGCGLSHVLLAKKLYNSGVSLALILEDDAFPKVCGLMDHIKTTIAETPEDWDMIKLHCNMCKNNNISHKGGSTAAYLLSSSGIKKLSDTKVNYHIDWQLNGVKNFKTYKSRYNLFWTDESFSINRGTNSTMFNIKTGLSGEQTLSQIISYKIFRIGTFEISNWHVVFIIITLILFYLV